jgi:hypothetical protein
MSLQRSVNNKLLRVPYSHNLMRECWCGTGYRYFVACCMPDFGDPYYPRILIISNARYAVLGDPLCVYYHSCMYCDDTGGNNEVACETNVDAEANVTSASPFDECTDPWTQDNCPPCMECGDCTAAETPSYVNISISSPKVNGTWKCRFIGINLFGYCEYEYDVGGILVNLQWYSGADVPDWIISYSDGVCVFNSTFVSLPIPDRCTFSDSYNITSFPDVECWANNVGDKCYFVITPP